MIERRTSPYFATLHTGYGQTPRQAAALQIEMARQVIRVDGLDRPTTVTGVDMGFEAGGTIARAAAVTLSFPELTWLESAVARGQTAFPYIPGLLSFRELPLVLQALGQLEQRPQLLLCDGQGYAHPRRFGIACHLGVVTGLPSIGVGKSRLIGTHREPGPKRGSRAALRDGGEIIGTVLRTRDGVRPLYVSVGHRVSLATATALVLKCAPKYRLPEPIREADRLASARY